jgi:hypothetical protein
VKALLLVICTTIFALSLLCIGAGSAWYVLSSQPTPEPVIQYSTPQVIEIPVEVPVEVEVVRTVEVVVTATPAPSAEPLQIPEVVQTTTETQEEPYVECFDDARIEKQPISDIQAGAIKYGTIKRLVWIVQNTGTCTWDGYTWESVDDPLVLSVPYTEPGQMATITHDVIARDPMSLRMFLMPPSRAGLLGLSNVNTQDDGAVYIMEVWSKLNYAPSGSYTQQVCGPNG